MNRSLLERRSNKFLYIYTDHEILDDGTNVKKKNGKKYENNDCTIEKIEMENNEKYKYFRRKERLVFENWEKSVERYKELVTNAINTLKRKEKYYSDYIILYSVLYDNIICARLRFGHQLYSDDCSNTFHREYHIFLAMLDKIHDYNRYLQEYINKRTELILEIKRNVEITENHAQLYITYRDFINADLKISELYIKYYEYDYNKIMVQINRIKTL